MSDHDGPVPQTAESPRVQMLVLLACALAMFASGMSSLSLPSLDDCFYARKAVEMARSGAVFRVTWAGEPTFQNPPLQFWIMGRSFAAFGESDAAARLPSVVMAVGIMALTYRIGVGLLGTTAALTGTALLLLTPVFVDNARRTMMEIPVTFWITLAMFGFLRGLERPVPAVLGGLAVGGAVLTKSVLGLLPLLAVAIVVVAAPSGGGALRARSLWLAGAVAVALGGSWTVYLWRVFGSDAVRGHYLGEIATRSMTGFDPLAVVTAYPLILLTDYQPLAIPGLIGAFVLFRDAWRDRHPGRMLLVVWIGLPLVLYGFGGARSVRYIFPILPPLALAAGYWLAQVAPSVALALRRYAVPAVALTVAVVFWVVPSWLTRDLNAVFKARASVFQESLADDERLVYVGDGYWEVANPLLYYASRELEPPARDLDEAVALARRSRAKLLLIDRERHEQLDRSGVEYETRLEGPRWLLVSVLAEP